MDLHVTRCLLRSSQINRNCYRIYTADLILCHIKWGRFPSMHDQCNCYSISPILLHKRFSGVNLDLAKTAAIFNGVGGWPRTIRSFIFVVNEVSHVGIVDMRMIKSIYILNTSVLKSNDLSKTKWVRVFADKCLNALHTRMKSYEKTVCVYWVQSMRGLDSGEMESNDGIHMAWSKHSHCD